MQFLPIIRINLRGAAHLRTNPCPKREGFETITA